MTLKHLIAVVVATAFAVSTALAEMVGFENETVGLPPSGFELWGTGEAGPGRWAIVRDESAQSGLALEQFSHDTIKGRFALAIYKFFSSADVEVRVRFKPISGTMDRAAGIAVRLTTPDDYYVARANALANNVAFYPVVKGKQDQLAVVAAQISADTWHTLALKADRHQFTVSLDGAVVMTVNDTTISAEGNVSLWTQADSVTRFDQLQLIKLPQAEDR